MRLTRTIKPAKRSAPYSVLLVQFLKSPADSRRAAAGWSGDRFAVYEGPKGEVLIASLSTWDTENDAREFFDAYVKRTELRYPGVERLDSPNSELRILNSVSWKTSEGTVAIELRGNRIVVVEGAPASIELRPFLRALGQQ